MRCSTILVLSALSAVTLAAPAPKPSVWRTGWDRPVDPSRDCRFDYDGDKLTITVPGKNHGLDVMGNRLNAPHLLREVRGDFDIQIRVSENFRPAGNEGYHRAGLLLMYEKTVLRVQRTASLAEKEKDWRLYIGMNSLGGKGGLTDVNPNPPVGIPAYLRVERRGHRFEVSSSEDGKKWTQRCLTGYKLPEAIKVGVVAEATADGEFKVEFDQFKLSRPGK